MLGAPPALPGPDPANPSSHYVFLFWNVPGHPLIKENPLDVNAPRGSHLTAWYGLTGGHGIRALAFSDSKNKVLAETPITSVDPAAAWAGGNSKEVSNQTQVVITAKGSIAGDTGEVFDGWLQFGSGIVSGPLTVPAGGDCYAFASYRNHKVKIQTTNRTALAYTRLLPGVAVDGAGEPQPPEPWASLGDAEQEIVVGMSLHEIASLVNDAGARSAIKKLGVQLAQNALTRLNAEQPEK